MRRHILLFFQPRDTPLLKIVDMRVSLNDVKRAYKAACDRAGIKDFRFHDLRHTFASHVIMKGASLKDAQELSAHASMAMTLRYAHLSQEHKRKAVNLLNGLTAKSDCHKTVTFPKPLDSVSL